MLVKLFDENHELDLEKKVNDFLANYDSQEKIMKSFNYFLKIFYYTQTVK